MKKLYVVQKYIMARSIKEALKLERRVVPDDIYVDGDFKKAHGTSLESSIGYFIEHEYYSADDIAKVPGTSRSRKTSRK